MSVDEYNKLIQEKDKREWRYKSTMKKNDKEAPKKVEDGKVNIDDLIDAKLTKIKEEESFITQHGNDALESTKKVLEKYPDLSYEDAFKLSAVWQDPANTADANAWVLTWQAWDVSWKDPNVITEAELYRLDDAQFAVIRDRIDDGSVKLRKVS